MIHASQLHEAAQMAAELKGIDDALASWPSAQSVIDSPYGAQAHLPAADGMLVTSIPDDIIPQVLKAMYEKFTARRAELRLQLEDMGVRLGVN